jgi:acetyl esterase/lipase
MDVSSKTKKSVSALVLAYTLAPEATFPTQLSQAASLLNYLLRDEKRSPSTIFISGDSAGGNLALTLLSHVLHPHPDKSVPEINLSEPLKGALLYSPWVSFSTEHDSYRRNAQSDMLPAVTARTWASMYLGSSKPSPGVIMGDSYSEPLVAETTWWRGMHNVVDNVLIWAGGGEVFTDGLTAFGKKFTEGWTAGGGQGERARLVVTPRMEHDEPIISPILGIKEKSEAQVLIEEWLQARVEER